MRSEERWEAHAEWWQREFTAGADVEYEEQILPLVRSRLAGARRVLDIGCGEGQVARHLTDAGATVIGLDPVTAQISAAHERAGGPRYVRARAEQLPCRAGAFDAVVVCLVLEHVDDFEVGIRDIARVLAPGGRFLLLVAHPLLQAPGSGWIHDTAVGERYWRIGAYLDDATVVDEVAPRVAFQFTHRPIHRYVNAMGRAGLLVDGMDEPPPPAALVQEMWDYPEADTIPRVLAVRARRLAV